MLALEQLIIEKVRQLDEHQQQQVLEFVESLQPIEFDFDTWFKELIELEAQLRLKYGENFAANLQDILDELREEASCLP